MKRTRHNRFTSRFIRHDLTHHNTHTPHAETRRPPRPCTECRRGDGVNPFSLVPEETRRGIWGGRGVRRALVTSRVPPSHRWSLACLIAEVIGLPQDGRSGPPREAESAPARREWKEVLGEVGERKLREEE